MSLFAISLIKKKIEIGGMIFKAETRKECFWSFFSFAAHYIKDLTEKSFF